MTVWEQERAPARTTLGWGLGSMVVGAVLSVALQHRPWWRAFGLQHAGWGAVDLVIALLAGRWQDRRMHRQGDPYAAAALEAERAQLGRVLWVNVVADAGYVGLGAALARHRRRRLAGAGAAVTIQGAFLLLHDAHHAWRTRPDNARAHRRPPAG